jgi:outer membrane receptor protein involved in Fe transport
VSNIAAYNVVMMNPDYGPYDYWTAATPWLSRFTNGNKWTAENNSWRYPGGRVGKWENDETEPLDSEQENTKQVTATATWNINSHLTFTNLAGYIRQDSHHFDNDPASPVYLWNQLRLYRYDYFTEEGHLEGNFFDNKLSFLAGFYYLHTRERQRTYSWGFQEFYLPSSTDPVVTNASPAVMDQAMLNFIHQWGAANANTALGQTLDPMTGKTIAQDLTTWRPKLAPAGEQPVDATDFNNMISDNINNDYSVFMNVTFRPTSKIDLQGGLRAAWNNGVNRVENPTGAFRTFALPMQGGRGYGPGSKLGYSAVVRSDNPYPGGVTLTPMVTGTYHWTDDLNTFFRFAEGYTTGSTSFNRVLNRDITLDPEIVYDYEAGIRSDWFDRRLRLNLTGYYMLWTGKQISTSITYGNTFAVVTTSGGKSRAQGFEAEMEAVPVRGLRLSASVATLDTKWLESGAQNIPAKTMWGLAPKWTYHLAAQYDFELANQAGITLRVDYGHQGKYQRDTDPGRQLLTPEPGYGLLNARIQYTAPSSRWNVQVFGTNLIDEAYVTAGTGSIYLFGVDATEIGQRRMFGARLNVSY